MKIVFILIFLFTFHLLYADQLGLTGSTIQLKCPAKLAPRRSLWFYTNGTQSVYLTKNGYINIDTLSPELYRRLSVSGNHSIGEYHLNIADIRKSDEGKYECIVGKDIGTVFLTVIVGPTALIIDNVTSDNKVPGIEGHDMTVKCTAVGGQPAPDVNLVILGLNYTGKQSAHHTFNPQRHNDGSTVTCQAGYKEIQHYPLNTTTHIHLKLKPVITPFSPDTVNTEETKVFAISCQATGSRPAAYIYWLLGPQRTNVTTNSTSQSNKESSTDTNNVTSYLKYRVDRKYNEQTLICIAVNVAGSMETSLTLNVKYAPGVTVENETFSLTQLSRQIQSTLDGNPIVNICTWHHRSQYGEHIRYFSDNNQILTLPTVSEDKRYQDTGEYVCTAADNGIIGINGQLKQTGSGYVISNAPPVITADNYDNSKQYGKIGTNTKLYVNVYSIPKYSSIRWYRGKTHLDPNIYVTTEESVIVKDVFHGVEVQLDGYRVTLTIIDLQEIDFSIYTLRLYYDTSGQYVQHEVILESASAPEAPSNFTVIGSGETSITVQWIPGYAGGQTQTFYIEYRIIGRSVWMSHEIVIRNKLDFPKVYTLFELQDKTSYELRMYAENIYNQSQRTDIQTQTTSMKEVSTSLDAIIGGVAGVLVALLLVFTVIIVVNRRRKGKKQNKKNAENYENSGFKDAQIGDGYEEVTSPCDMQHYQSSKTYESLGTKDAVDVYDDLQNPKDLTSSKSSFGHSDALKADDKSNVYVELENRTGQTENVYVNEAF